MSGQSYEVFEDPYCYKGTFVLKNKRGLRNAAALEQFELEMTTARADEPFPSGRFGAPHYRALHRHLFQDVYAWAGRYRTVRTSKGGNAFCYPENIAAQMEKLFLELPTGLLRRGASPEEFALSAAKFLAELNAIHPFREGNGRSQLSFLYLAAAKAGHPLDFSRIRPTEFLDAMIVSFEGVLMPLKTEIHRLFV